MSGDKRGKPTVTRLKRFHSKIKDLCESTFQSKFCHEEILEQNQHKHRIMSK